MSGAWQQDGVLMNANFHIVMGLVLVGFGVALTLLFNLRISGVKIFLISAGTSLVLGGIVFCVI